MNTTKYNVTNQKLHKMRNLNGSIRMEIENGHEDLHGVENQFVHNNEVHDVRKGNEKTNFSNLSVQIVLTLEKR